MLRRTPTLLLATSVAALVSIGSLAADRKNAPARSTSRGTAATAATPKVQVPPDLVVSAIRFDDVRTATNAQNLLCHHFQLTVAWKNQGASPAIGNFRVQIDRKRKRSGGFDPVKTLHTNDLQPGESRTADRTVHLNTCGFQDADYLTSPVIRVTVDPTNEIAESNTNNNRGERAFDPGSGTARPTGPAIPPDRLRPVPGPIPKPR